MDIIIKLILAGLNTLLEYLSFHVITCLIPAFFIAGAIRVFLPPTTLTRYFGPTANKWLSYGLASVSGTVLAVCSCTVIPMFAGMYMSGAGLGPSIAFLYSGPAINVLAIVYSARLLGLDLGIGRAVFAVLFAVVVGLIMGSVFRQKTVETVHDDIAIEIEAPELSPLRTGLFFLLLLIILVFGAAKSWLIAGAALILLFIVLFRWFTRQDIRDWLIATFGFLKLILPYLLIGVFAAGVIRELLPQQVVSNWVGTNSISANLIASLVGSLMYFATLTEVPIVRALLDLQMSKGPALALLLAGPALSLPNMLAIGNVLGLRKTLLYILLVVVMATISGMIFGTFF